MNLRARGALPEGAVASGYLRVVGRRQGQRPAPALRSTGASSATASPTGLLEWSTDGARITRCRCCPNDSRSPPWNRAWVRGASAPRRLHSRGGRRLHDVLHAHDELLLLR